MSTTERTNVIVDENYSGLRKESYRYVLPGNLEATGSIEIKLDMLLYVEGSIKAGDSIEAGGSIKAGDSIKAGGFIKAGGSIKAGDSIKAGFGVVALKGIVCLRVYAGICFWRKSTPEEQKITCSELKGEVGWGTLEIRKL